MAVRVEPSRPDSRAVALLAGLVGLVGRVVAGSRVLGVSLVGVRRGG